MNEELRIIFETVSGILKSNFGKVWILCAFGLGNLYIIANCLKRAFMPPRRREEERKQDEEPEYYNTNSDKEPWEIPDKKL